MLRLIKRGLSPSELDKSFVSWLTSGSGHMKKIILKVFIHKAWGIVLSKLISIIDRLLFAARHNFMLNCYSGGLCFRAQHFYSFNYDHRSRMLIGMTDWAEHSPETWIFFFNLEIENLIKIINFFRFEKMKILIFWELFRFVRFSQPLAWQNCLAKWPASILLICNFAIFYYFHWPNSELSWAWQKSFTKYSIFRFF